MTDIFDNTSGQAAPDPTKPKSVDSLPDEILPPTDSSHELQPVADSAHDNVLAPATPAVLPGDIDGQAQSVPLRSSQSASIEVVSSRPEPVIDKALQASARSYQDHFTLRRGDAIFWIELEKIEPNPFQPRREFNEDSLRDLAASIREHGVLQPVVVTKREVETPRGLQVTYELIAGERRWRASKLAGLSQIPAVIRRGIPNDHVKLELAIIENVQREDLNAMDRAKAFKQLIDEFHFVQHDIAARIGKSREMIANSLRLLALPVEIQQAVQSRHITEGHARAILMVGTDPRKQFEIYQAILNERMNVREAESHARQMTGKTIRPSKRAASIIDDPEIKQWQNRLQEQLGTKVQLQRIGQRGKIVMEFYSEEEMRGLLHKLISEQGDVV